MAERWLPDWVYDEEIDAGSVEAFLERCRSTEEGRAFLLGLVLTDDQLRDVHDFRFSDEWVGNLIRSKLGREKQRG